MFTVALGTNHGTLGSGGVRRRSLRRLGPVRRPPRPRDARSDRARHRRRPTFRAQSADKVEQIYKQLGASIARRPVHREVTSWFAGAAALLLLGSLGATRATGGRLP